MTDLVIKTRLVSDLLPYARNARTHSDEQVAQIAASIREFGWTNPILVDGHNGIIAGHGRVLAARKLGILEVPTIELAHLTDTQRRAYILADNRLAENAGWDQSMLALELEDLRLEGFDLDLTGFDAGAIESIFEQPAPDFQPGTEEDQGKLDQLEPKLVKCPHCGQEFDSREQS